MYLTAAWPRSAQLQRASEVGLVLDGLRLDPGKALHCADISKIRRMNWYEAACAALPPFDLCYPQDYVLPEQMQPVTWRACVVRFGVPKN